MHSTVFGRSLWLGTETDVVFHYRGDEDVVLAQRPCAWFVTECCGVVVDDDEVV